MSKRRINKQQARRIYDRAQTQTQSLGLKQGPQRGLVIARYGHYVELETQDKRRIRCLYKQHVSDIVVGDQVIWDITDTSQGRVTAREPRRTVLHKYTPLGTMKAVAANIDQLLITIATVPAVETLAIDSYLVAAEHLGLEAIILLNKQDLAHYSELSTIQENYAAIGYLVLPTSIYHQENLQALLQAMDNKISVFVGQSGVGKSSLIRALLPEADLQIADIKLHDALYGQHTTTRAQLYHLPGQIGKIIDSPGTRGFSLWPMDRQAMAYGFKEFRPYLGQCQFSNCQHETEIYCALKAAVKLGHIQATRLHNYKLLLQAP